MSTEDFSRDLITYLYDEMSMEERQQFEIAMENNPELKREFEELKGIRKGLASIHDKEVMEPFFLWGKNGLSSWTAIFKRRNLLIFKPFIAVAASLVLVLLAGYLTNFSIRYENKALFIGFNTSEGAEQTAGFTKEEITSLVNQEIAKNNAYVFTKLTETENSFDARFASLESAKDSSVKSDYLPSDLVTQKELDVFLTQVRNNNLRVLNTYLQSSSVQQQDYFQAVLKEFSNYMETQREEDLRLIRRSLVDLQENQQTQKAETDQILANILTTVNNQNN